jgi:hypothetical protein
MARPRQRTTDHQQGSRGNWQSALLGKNPEEQHSVTVPDHELGCLVHMDLGFTSEIKDSSRRGHTLECSRDIDGDSGGASKQKLRDCQPRTRFSRRQVSGLRQSSGVAIRITAELGHKLSGRSA